MPNMSFYSEKIITGYYLIVMKIGFHNYISEGWNSPADQGPQLNFLFSCWLYLSKGQRRLSEELARKFAKIKLHKIGNANLVLHFILQGYKLQRILLWQQNCDVKVWENRNNNVDRWRVNMGRLLCVSRFAVRRKRCWEIK